MCGHHLLPGNGLFQEWLMEGKLYPHEPMEILQELVNEPLSEGPLP